MRPKDMMFGRRFGGRWAARARGMDEGRPEGPGGRPERPEGRGPWHEGRHGRGPGGRPERPEGRGRWPEGRPGGGPGGPPERGWGRRGGPRPGRGDVRSAVLTLLAEKPLHGYEMMQQITTRSGGTWRPSPGSVYPAL